MGLVLRVQVDKSAQVHSTAEKKVYVRVGAQSLPVASAEQITALAFSKGAKSYEDYVVPASRMELIVESSAIKSFLADYSREDRPSRFRSESTACRF
jgi:ATP-dependent DNA helicase RecG